MNELNLDNYASKVVGDIQLSIVMDVKQVAQQALIDALNKTVYLQQKQYRQTKDLLGAVEVSNMKIGHTKATFSVIINASRMQVEMRHPELNAHASAGKDGKDFREELIGVLDKGTGAETGRMSPIYNHEGYGFFEKAYQDMDANLIVAMAKALKRKGYKVEIY